MVKNDIVPLLIVVHRERGLYFGVVGAVIAIASATGPIVGGVLTQSASWRWCFWVNSETHQSRQ